MATLYTHSIGNPLQNPMVVFKLRDSVPSARYSPICNVLRQWKTSLTPINFIESTDSVGTSELALQSRLSALHYHVPWKPTECVNALCSYRLSRLHAQACIDRNREQAPTSKMIAHSWKAVDEDGGLYFVCFFLLYFIITNKNERFVARVQRTQFSKVFDSLCICVRA